MATEWCTALKCYSVEYKATDSQYIVLDDCIYVLTFLTSSCVVRWWTSSNWWWTARLPLPVKVVFLGVVPVAEVFLKCAVPFGWRLCGWRSWCSGEGCWPSRSMETPRDIWNRTVPATSTRLALCWRDSKIATVLPEKKVRGIVLVLYCTRKLTIPGIVDSNTIHPRHLLKWSFLSQFCIKAI